MTLIFAALAAIGVFTFVEALRPAPPRVRLMDEDARPLSQRAMSAFFAPAAARVVRGDLEAHEADLARKLARAGHPAPFTTPEAVMGYRMFTAALFAAFGGVFCLLTGMVSVAPVSMGGLAVAGWLMPVKAVANAEARRREQLVLDAASTLDRLAIYVAAGNALPSAVISLAERPGGAWVGEFRRIAADYAVQGDFGAALDGAVERSGRLPEITRVCQRLNAAYEMGGGGIAQSLRAMAQDARVQIKNVITERGYENAVMMVIPAFFAIVATVLVLIGPGAIRMVSVLGG